MAEDIRYSGEIDYNDVQRTMQLAAEMNSGWPPNTIPKTLPIATNFAPSPSLSSATLGSVPT